MPSCSDCNFCRIGKVRVNCTTGLSMDGFDGPAGYSIDLDVPGVFDATTFILNGYDTVYVSPNLYTFDYPCTVLNCPGIRFSFIGTVEEFTGFQGISGSVGNPPFGTPNVELLWPTGGIFAEGNQIKGDWETSVSWMSIQSRFDFDDTCNYIYQIYINFELAALDQFGVLSRVIGTVLYENHINIYNNFDTLNLYRQGQGHKFGIFGNYLGDIFYERFSYFPYTETGIKTAAQNALLAWSAPDTITLTAL